MSDKTISVSKGIFSFNTDGINQHKQRRSTISTSRNIFGNRLWYKSYLDTWNTIESKIEALNNEMYSNVLSSMVLAIKESYNNNVTEIPTAALLTGINMPDHSAKFTALAVSIKKSFNARIATLHAEDCMNLKYLIENTVYQMINNSNENRQKTDDDYTRKRTAKSYCTLAYLQAWYEEISLIDEKKEGTAMQLRGKIDGKKILVVIVPDFENCNAKVMQDFILILSSYINILPFVLVFGVATSASALHKLLPYHVSSKLSIQIFNTQQSVVHLTNIVNNAFFIEDCPFSLGGSVFNFFMDNFLFYDLSVTNFIKNYKFAVLEHFSERNFKALCTHPKHFTRILDQLSKDDLQTLRTLTSFEDYLSKVKPANKSELMKDDDHLRKLVKEKCHDYYIYINMFHLHLKCLHVLVGDLPQAPLGKEVRELYCLATTKDITKSPAYKKCFQLLSFQSKDELLKKFKLLCELYENAKLQNDKSASKIINDHLEQLEDYVEELENVTTEMIDETVPDVMPEKLIFENRKQFREKLFASAKTCKPLNKYEKLRSKLIPYLEELLQDKLQQPTLKLFHEIFYFDDMSIKRRIIGSHRAAIHTALSNPHHYLQCKCCKLEDENRILKCMPDISILYKLHLEYGRIINLYDWLQSFLSIIEPNNDTEEKIVVRPEVQARFTQGVADLEFLGFIKSSKRKPDYVTRLTWGG